MRRRTLFCLAVALALAACSSPATLPVPVRETVLVVVTATPQPLMALTPPPGTGSPPATVAAQPTQSARLAPSIGDPDYARGLYMAAGPAALDFVAQQQSQLKGCAERGELTCACGIELTDQRTLLDELSSQSPPDRFSAFHDDLVKVLTAWQGVRKDIAAVCQARDAAALLAAAEKLRAMDEEISRALESWDALRSEG